MATIPSTIALTTVRAGDTWQWSAVIDGYSRADGWTLKYALRGPGQIDIVTVVDPSNAQAHLVSVAKATTAGYAKGDYTFVAFVEDASGNRFTITGGTIVVQPDLSAAAATFD